MNYLSVESLTKSYGEKVLFQNISFGLEKGDKIALVAQNGTGKTSLFKVLYGTEDLDSGSFAFKKDVKIAFLAQEPNFKDAKNIEEVIFNDDNKTLKIIKNYEDALVSNDSDKLSKAMNEMENEKAWDFEQKIQQILTKLKINDMKRPLDVLSGGQKRRLSLAQVLLSNPEFIILDEPTNHLDLEMIEWLEEYLTQQNLTILMVTHDRYFLENICNHIFELANGQLYKYKGNYSYFLEKKEEREYNEASEVMKARNLMRKELDWIRRMPKARGTKAKYRVDAFQELKQKASTNLKKENLSMSINMQRIGGKIMEIKNLSHSFENLKILDNFSYIFKKGEKIGVIGQNGVGKSTLLNVLTNQIELQKGIIEVGETIRFGYYKQDGLKLPEDKRVIEVVTDIAEVITIGKNHTVSPMHLLERFLFPPKQQYTYVSTLSGGEKRRLYLLTILAQNPNFLILDEPTNDLDIITLQILEDFLADFQGCLLVVTHDRYFMDRLVDHIWAMEGNGKIRDFNGTYSEYSATLEYEKELAAQEEIAQKEANILNQNAQKRTQKLSFKEQKELENLEIEIPKLENEQKILTEKLNNASLLSHDEIMKTAKELENITKSLDEKSFLWLELTEK
ncbi:MAG: ABC transporter ATP-binding protein [Bacteroidetes bacterium]|nr:MAG: ABC transporter ATP-binding protein [Bacteroidota bacterium]TAG88381.1 MAG: ABC transporter ATP-binding protein [Bacteroidota bacterium]